MLICVISTFRDDDCVDRAWQSAYAAGVDYVQLFDGPWQGFVPGAWETQAEKRTRMFHECAVGPGDFVLSLDADEEVDGTFPTDLPLQHHHVWLQNTGDNDLPGVRLEWPWGDGGTKPFPLLRLFAYSPGLACYTGGVWTENGALIRPYDDRANPLLPIVEGVRILHHAHERSPERQAQKEAFYRKDHPRRRLLPPL